MKMVSQREDSINQFKQANRLDLAENEQKELDIIKEYAPKQGVSFVHLTACRTSLQNP